MEIRLLTVKDVEMFRRLRLQALHELPKAFAASYHEEKNESIAYFTSLLSKSIGYVGAFSERNQLIGILGIVQSHLAKMKHKASFTSFYVVPECRRIGVGNSLLHKAIEFAKLEGIEQIQLVVAKENIRAKRKYESLGFKTFAKEERALKVNGEYIDEEHFVLFV
ncbi:GNAT family N-acetyltransferase [Halalkalibacter urbisdiaboli]|uniref:GNAT family N-acetyltransferase n=1 Tax=Halalkalibacter urbisdiaboli TaxID=1960589 RepID=UPI000B451CCD|nr:GNAT family N-acetyltransferase [Halalkalibacter urbisdiaboli]